jgi:hypothetical protein
VFITAATAVSAVALQPLAAQAAGSTVTVRQAGIASGSPWGVAAGSSGTAGIGPLADPVHSDGSAQIAVGPGQQARLVHPINHAGGGESLKTLMATPLAYDLFVDAQRSTADSITHGANLQLEVFVPSFTTLSFQPQLNGGVVANRWHTFTNTAHSLWRTSRAVGSLAAGSDHTLAEYLTAFGGDATVGNAYLNVGTLGDPAAKLATYVDDVAIGGTQYNFAVNDLDNTATVVAPRSAEPGDTVHAKLTFRTPSDGVQVRNATARVTFSGISGLGTNLTVTPGTAQHSAQRSIRRAADPVTVILPVPGGTVEPGHTSTVPFTLHLGPGAGVGTLVISGVLLNDGVTTGIHATTSMRIFEEASASPSRRPGSATGSTTGGSRPAGPELANSGSDARTGWLGGILLVVTGSAMVAAVRRRRSHLG